MKFSWLKAKRARVNVDFSRKVDSLKFWLFHRICRFGHSHFSENPSYPEFFAPLSERQQHARNWRDLCSTFWQNVFVINSSSSKASIFFAFIGRLDYSDENHVIAKFLKQKASYKSRSVIDSSQTICYWNTRLHFVSRPSIIVTNVNHLFNNCRYVWG